MRRLVLGIALACTVLGCTEDEPKIDHVPIAGEWKLVSVHGQLWHSYLFDLTDKDVVYDFRANGVLVVDRDGEESVPHTDGQHSYSFEIQRTGGQAEKWVVIDGERWTHSLSDGFMVLSLAHVDGGVLTFSER